MPRARVRQYGLFRYRDKVFPCRRQSCIWLERQDSRGDSHHSAIEPASATMHDEMKVQRYFWRGVRFLAAAVVIFVAAYTACIGVTWYQYGRVWQPPHADSTDALLDSFIPAFDVARRQLPLSFLRARMAVSAVGRAKAPSLCCSCRVEDLSSEFADLQLALGVLGFARHPGDRIREPPHTVTCGHVLGIG